MSMSKKENQIEEQAAEHDTKNVTPEQASEQVVSKEQEDLSGMTLYQKLLYVQKNCKAPKSQRNNYGNYNYRTVDDIFAALKPLLWKVQATVTISDEIEERQNGNYIKATVEFIDCVTGEKLTGTAFSKEGVQKGMTDAQASGSASTYARKYALNGLFLLDDSRDIDSMDNTGYNNGGYDNSGYQNGYSNGNNSGYNQGYQNNGYNQGYQNNGYNQGGYNNNGYNG